MAEHGLYGREKECATLDALLDRARHASGDALVVTGEPGMGKTALLGYAADRADGMRVLRAQGVHAESRLPFAGLHALLRPALDLLPALPTAQADALSAALGMDEPKGQSRFLVAAGVLGLLAELADHEPVLCLVDDAQWIDGSSMDALFFAARRIESDRLAVVVSARLGELEPPGLAELRLDPIAPDQADRLLTAHAPALDPPSRRRIVELAAGNPLALVELSDDVPAPTTPSPPGRTEVPLSARLEATFLGRVHQLTPDAQRLLLVAASDDSGDLLTLQAASRPLGIGTSTLAEAERAKLLRLAGERVEFVHPLVASAVYQAALPSERRQAHEALAAALPDDQADRRAWHRAAAATTPDESLAADLEHTALAARARAGHQAAAAALERAAELSPSPHERARRLLDAAEDAWEAGRAPQASRLVDRAAQVVSTPLVQGRVAQLRGRFESRRGVVRDGFEMLLAAADLLAAVEPHRAAASLVEALEAAFLAGDQAMVAELGRRVVELEADEDMPAVEHVTGMTLLLGGDVERATPLLRSALERSQHSENPEVLLMAAVAAGYLGDGVSLAQCSRRAVAVARARGALGTLTRMLELSAIAEVTTSPAAAEAHASEGLELARETDQPPAVAMHLAMLATVAAIRGDEQATVEHTYAVRRLAARHGLSFPDSWVRSMLALLDLGLGHAERALERLEQLAVDGHPGVQLTHTPDLVEAAVRVGEPERALPLFAAFEAWATSSQSASVAGQLHRCRALLSDGDVATAHYERSVAALSRFGPSLDRARTLLLLGEHLRRERRRVEARPHLRDAAEEFERLGARPWAERAWSELRASGERVRRRDDDRARLTPQELQIAGLVVVGSTNKEIAGQLYLSPRTVDAHLRSVYAKLGIASRGQLRQVDLVG